MSPGATVTREQSGSRIAPSLPYPPGEFLLGLAKEMVVDWQLPSESDRKG
jgi:hypothetical protein